MARRDLERANRALLSAIEAAPPAGVEGRLDRIAAATWNYARTGTPAPAPGRIRHLEYKLDRIARETEGRKRRRIERARARLRRFATRLDPV